MDYSKVEIHHIFPKNSGKEKDRRNNLMNLALLSADKNKVISDKEPEEYWNDIRKDAKDFKKMLRMNIILHGKFYAGKVKGLEPVSYEDTPPVDECKFGNERLKLFVDALYKIFGM